MSPPHPGYCEICGLQAPDLRRTEVQVEPWNHFAFPVIFSTGSKFHTIRSGFSFWLNYILLLWNSLQSCPKPSCVCLGCCYCSWNCSLKSHVKIQSPSQGSKNGILSPVLPAYVQVILYLLLLVVAPTESWPLLEMTWLLNMGPFKVYRFWLPYVVVSILAH